MKVIDCIQGTPEWHAVRRGKITMSHAKDLLTGGAGKTRESYLLKVAAERVSDYPDPDYRTNDMVRGNELEPFARRIFEALMGPIGQVGFVLHDNEQIGCSPDGLGETYGLEIKCPRPDAHIKYMSAAFAAKEHGPQMQGCLWICERPVWYFVSFCPWVADNPFICHKFQRDDDMIAKIASSALSGVEEVAAMVGQVNSALPLTMAAYSICDEAKKHWEFINAADDEVIL
jgi:hypothetical protein